MANENACNKTVKAELITCLARPKKKEVSVDDNFPFPRRNSD